MQNYSLLILLFLILGSCKDPVLPSIQPKQNLEQNSYENRVLEEQFKTNKSRDVWQRPAEVLDLLGDIEDKTVADIGAGTGFFAFRVLLRNANVIAIDIDPQMLEIVEGFKMNLSKSVQKNIETRLALPNDPKIKKDEADIIMIINTIGYIENRIDYLENLYQVLPSGGKLLIVDFKSKALPIEAPSLENRVPLFQIEKDLKTAGFNTIQSNDSKLDYQYMIVAEK